MKAPRYVGPRDVRDEDMADPSVGDGRDVAVNVDRCGICGSGRYI